MHGLLIIDKPQGITSHDVVRRVRRLYGTRRVGHAGTLDPLATGILLVAVGEGTRLVEYLMAGEKTYRATLKLGEITDTQDSEGRLLQQRPVPALERSDIEAACGPFTGCIRQCPPMFSALKRNGLPLYHLARQGIEVDREARQVEIRRLTILEIDLPYVSIEVECSKGTYIRTLCHDLGLALGPGGHLVSLRRIRSGAFGIDDGIPLAELESGGRHAEAMLNLSQALRGYPARVIMEPAAARLRHGIPPALEETAGSVLAEGEIVQLLHDGALLALGRYAPLRTQEKRGDFELRRVFHCAGGG